MELDPLYSAFGRLVRHHRERLKLTQDQLGERIGLSRTSITNIERGRQKVLLHQFFRLAESLGVSPDALLPNVPAAPQLPHIEQKLPKNLTATEKEWVRRVMTPGSTEGGAPYAVTQDRSLGAEALGGPRGPKPSGPS